LPGAYQQRDVGTCGGLLDNDIDLPLAVDRQVGADFGLLGSENSSRTLRAGSGLAVSYRRT
jgi:hypothetical protein